MSPEDPLSTAAVVAGQRARLAGRDGLQGNGTILVVDDEPDVRRACCLALRRAGYTAVEAGSVDDAMELWQKVASNIDVLLTDYQMRGPTGIQLCEQLHAVKPGLGMILMSGSYGGDLPLPPYVQFLPKPFTLQKLVQAVGTVAAK